MRIGGTVPVYRWSLITIMAISNISGITNMIGIVASCSPPSAFWDPSTGECNAFVKTFAAYFISACSILTDFALAILPAFILWKIKLRRSIKVSVAIILGFAAFASSATLVRLRYFLALLDIQNFLLGSGKIAVWTVIELGIGIIAGSLPTLRPLLKYVLFLRHTTEDGSHKYKKNSSGNDLDLVTFGGGTYGQAAHNPRAKKIAEDRDSQELILDEGEGQRGIAIRKDVSVSVERRSSQDIDLEREQYYGVARG